MNRALLLLAMVIGTACRQLPPQEAEASRANIRARSIWERHETAVVRAVRGEIRGDEFSEACNFFKDVAGIEIHGDGTFLGWVPVKETSADLERVRAWYRKNGDRLYAESGRVKVRPEGEKR